jgi:hypothetical protein
MSTHWLFTYRRYKSYSTGRKSYQVGISDNGKTYKWLRKQ